MNFRFILPALVLVGLAAAAEINKAITLPPPHTDGGMPLMQALKERKTTREFSPAPLAPQMLSDLLWAGFGINRPDNGHRTAPSAMNQQELDLYVATTDGVYLYDAKANQLLPVVSDDIRTRTGKQDYVKVAPIALILIADFGRMTKPKPEDKDRYATIDAGYISQNLYLFCSSAGLATVVHEIDQTELRDVLHLKPDQKIIIAQSVGYPQNH